MQAHALVGKESATTNSAPSKSGSTHAVEPMPEASKDEFTPAKFAWNIGSVALSAAGGDRPRDDDFRPKARLNWPIQAKLEVGPVDDPLEREADRVADQVLRTAGPMAIPGAGSEGASSPSSSSGIAVQRKCECGGTCAKCQAEEQEEKSGSVQRKPAARQMTNLGSSPANAGMAAPPTVHEVLRSPGQPMDASTRSFFAPHFGQELLRVRLHSDRLAERSANELSARAYTVGNDIVFGAGQYKPETHEGRLLLAHELTHVVQQNGNQVSLQRQPAKNSDADRAAAVADAEAATACTTKQLEKQYDEEDRLKLDGKKRNDTDYALLHGARDKRRLEKRGLSAQFAIDIGVKMRFFEGGAKASYIRSVAAALSNYPDEAQQTLEPCAPVEEEEASGPPQAQINCDAAKKEFVLQYEDEPEKARCIRPSDPEFDNLFDHNIASAAAYSVPATTWENVTYNSFELLAVKYKNGTGEYFLLDELGNFHYGETVLGIREFTFFKRKSTGLIYPITNGRVYFNEALTPRILAYKNGLTYQVKQLQDLYQLLQAAGAFAQIIALNALNEDFKSSIQGLNRSRFEGFKSVKTRGGGGGGGGGRVGGAGAAGDETSSGVPDPLEDTPTERINSNERLGKQVGDFTIAGDGGHLEGDTYEIEIGGLFGKTGRSGNKDTRQSNDVSGIKNLVNTLIEQGKASGAKQLKIRGWAVVNKNIMRDGRVKILGLVKAVGGTVRATGPDSLEITIPLK